MVGPEQNRPRVISNQANVAGNRPVPKSAKEHIANLEQIGYITFIAGPPRQSFVPLANPRHKEHDPMSNTALRIVEGSSMDKSKALAAALSQIERQFGKGSVMKLGKNDRSMDVESVSSG